MKGLIRSIFVTAVTAALVTGAVAVANQGDNGRQGRDQPGAGRPHGPPPFFRDLTYAEIHVQRDGQGVVLRDDRGKVKSVSDDSITITENDGNDVTIPTDGDTKVLAGPGRELKTSDLKDGQLVVAHREQGKAADAIVVPPKHPPRRDFLRRAPHGAPGGQGEAFPAPPPPGGDAG